MFRSYENARSRPTASYIRLAFFEELRAECNRLGAPPPTYITAWTVSSGSCNPNLHEILPASAFRIELWDRYDENIRWVVAASASISISNAAFDAATLQFSDQRLALRKGIMLLREHVPPGK
jgi:hypothetical protein